MPRFDVSPLLIGENSTHPQQVLPWLLFYPVGTHLCRYINSYQYSAVKRQAIERTYLARQKFSPFAGGLLPVRGCETLRLSWMVSQQSGYLNRDELSRKTDTLFGACAVSTQILSGWA